MAGRGILRESRPFSERSAMNGGSKVKLVWGILTLVSLLVVLVLVMLGVISL